MEGGSKLTPLAQRLEGKVALITGGASGIGEATVRLFVSHGAKVVIADIQDNLGLLVTKELDVDGNVIFIHCDVTKEIDVKNAVDTTVSKYGKLDIVFSNAGITGKFGINILQCTSEEFKGVFDTNVYGSFVCAKHAARVMIPAKKGSIIFTASIAAVIAGGMAHAYTMSKHAVVGMSKSMCSELGRYGIRVNCVSPYAVATPLVKTLMNNDDESKVEEVFESMAILKQVTLKANDIAEAVLYLASDDAKYVSGQNLVVDGGYSITNPTFPVEFKVVSNEDAMGS